MSELTEAIAQFRALNERRGDAESEAYIARMRKRRAAYRGKESDCSRKGGKMRWGRCIVRGKAV